MTQHATPDPSADDIAQDVAAAIVAHRLPPGTRLREEALGRAYQVSRTKIRAALLMLSKDKLINIVPDKGAFVSKPSADEAREVYAVRRILETALAREFTARARPADFRRIEAHLAGNARRWRVATRRRATACWATSTCCSPRSSATRCSPTCCASCWRAAPSSPRCTRARTTPAVPRASTVPSSRPRAGRRRRRQRPDGRTPAPCAGRPDFQAGAQGDADLVTALLR